MKRLKFKECHPEAETHFELTEVFAFPDPTLALFLDNEEEDSCEGANLSVEQATLIRDWLNRWLEKVETGSGDIEYTIWSDRNGNFKLCEGLIESEPEGDWVVSLHFCADDREEAEEKFQEHVSKRADW